MMKYKDILVSTASTLEGIKILAHLNPISTHIVAGTNLFSDLFASLSDVFGGRSSTYQKQISSLYNQAIDELRIKAFELGANGIIGLKVDMDEISGKGKSMFMITAIGSAVVIESQNLKANTPNNKSKIENVSVENINLLRKRNHTISLGKSGKLVLDEKTWEFITANQVFEIFDNVIGLVRKQLDRDTEGFNTNYEHTLNYFASFTDEKKVELIYNSIANEQNENFALRLCSIVEKFNLLDFNYINKILALDDFKKQKLAVRLLCYDKEFYSKDDLIIIENLIETLNTKFPEKGEHSTKKGVFSSKEKEIWICECKTSNEIGTTCKNCFKDIYGFTNNDIKFKDVIVLLEERANLISEFV